MENQTQQMATAAAWRQAIDLTRADVRRAVSFCHMAWQVIIRLVWAATALALVTSEGDDLTLNGLGVLMLILMYMRSHRP